MTKQDLYIQFLYLAKRMNKALSVGEVAIAKSAKKQMDKIYDIFLENMWSVDELFFWLWKGARGIYALENGGTK